MEYQASKNELCMTQMSPQGTEQMRITLRQRERRITMRVLGMLASLALHALLLSPALLDAWAHAKDRLAHRAGHLSSPARNDDTPMTVTFLDESDDAIKAGYPIERPVPLGATTDKLLIPVAFSAPQPTPAVDLSSVDVQTSAATANSGESDPGLAIMLGRYVGQIRARIDRAWIRPRAPITSGQFQCRARIRQDATGNVLEIELEACNESPAWQLSLVHAIQSASPLPAPPDQDVFSEVLTLEFSATTFSPGGDPEGFESESRTAMK